MHFRDCLFRTVSAALSIPQSSKSYGILQSHFMLYPESPCVLLLSWSKASCFLFGFQMINLARAVDIWQQEAYSIRV